MEKFLTAWTQYHSQASDKTGAQTRVNISFIFHGHAIGNGQKGRHIMKKVLLVSSLLLFLVAGSGCSSKGGNIGLGAGVGVLAGAGGYEFHLKRQKDKVEEELKNGTIDQKEYAIRIDQIKRDSLVQ